MRMTKSWVLAGAAALALCVSAFGYSAKTAQADVKVEEGVESYKPAAGISGTLSSVGSDTLNNLMTFWAEGFKKHYPNVTFAVEGKGSSTAPPALIDGTADLGPMSREMKKEEIKKFEDKFGYKPGVVAVSYTHLTLPTNREV